MRHGTCIYRESKKIIYESELKTFIIICCDESGRKVRTRKQSRTVPSFHVVRSYNRDAHSAAKKKLLVFLK